jgi:hypothetical protein
MAYGLLSMIMHMEDVSRREKMENGMLTRVRLSVNVFGHPAIAIGYFRILVVYMYVANYLQSTPLSLSLSQTWPPTPFALANCGFWSKFGFMFMFECGCGRPMYCTGIAYDGRVVWACPLARVALSTNRSFRLNVKLRRVSAGREEGDVQWKGRERIGSGGSVVAREVGWGRWMIGD